MSATKESGTSTVEFAIVLPLLLVILFGIIEFAVALFNQAMITNAAREGARAGIVYNGTTPITEEQIQAVVNTYLGSNLINLGGTSSHSTTVTPGGGAGQPLTVTVDYQYDFLVLRPIVRLLRGEGDFPGSLTLGATSVMRME